MEKGCAMRCQRTGEERDDCLVRKSGGERRDKSKRAARLSWKIGLWIIKDAMSMNYMTVLAYD